MKRREFLKNALTIGAGAVLLPSCARHSYKLIMKNDDDDETKDSGFTFVHLTDQHVEKERDGDQGYRKCIQSVKALKPLPRFAIMGGDMVFDGNYNTKEKYLRDMSLYTSITDELGIPYFHCMGNHDTLGYSSRRKVSVDDPDFGKKGIQRILKWPSTYYSLDYRGWHFTILDCMKEINDPKYGPLAVPEIDGEQLKWLEGDLGRAHGKPIIVFTHVAAFCNIGQINSDKKRKAMDGHMTLNNNKVLREILERHKVKALIQGHCHFNEDYKYHDIWYITGAAVSAAWWSGNWTGDKPTFTIFNCKGNDFTWNHRTYDWEPHLEPQDTLERKKNQELAAFQKKQKSLAKEEILTGLRSKAKPRPKQKFALK